MLPLGVITPILFPKNSVNQRFPFGPVVIPVGSPKLVGTGYSAIMVPDELITHHSRNELGKSGIFWHTEEHERRASNNN